MAVFRNEPEEWQRLDWMILQSGYTCLYSRQEFLVRDMLWFRQERYRVLEFDCTTWKNEATLHMDLKQKLRFPERHSSNFDALHDSLKEISITGKGMVLVLHHLDAVHSETSQKLLNTLVVASQWHLLLGERLLTLVQVDDSEKTFEPVGARPVNWNPHEWLSPPGP
ncbi:barstar family protein [Pontibacter sp. CAU 1760]